MHSPVFIVLEEDVNILSFSINRSSGSYLFTDHIISSSLFLSGASEVSNVEWISRFNDLNGLFEMHDTNKLKS